MKEKKIFIVSLSCMRVTPFPEAESFVIVTNDLFQCTASLFLHLCIHYFTSFFYFSNSAQQHHPQKMVYVSLAASMIVGRER